MAIIGSIVVGMVAQTDKFLAPLAKAEKAMAKFGSNMSSFLMAPVGRIEALWGKVGGAVTAAFERIDKAGDAADRIGTTTAKLEELRYAAKMTGSETEAMDAALVKFSANLGDAVANDMAPAAIALKRMKIDPKQLATMDITDALETVSGAMNTFGTDAEKNAALMDLFGKGGIAIGNTMKAGAGAIRAARDEFRSYGGAVSETQRQQVAGMMDTVGKAGEALAGLGTQVAVGVAPYVDAVISSLIDMGGAGETASDKVASGMDWIIRRIADVADFAQGARNVFLFFVKVANQAWVAIVEGAAWAARGLDHLLKSLTGYTTGVGEFMTTMSEEFAESSKKFQEDIMKTIGDESWGDKFKQQADKAVAKSREVAKQAAQANKKQTQEVTTDRMKAAEAEAKKRQEAAKRIREDSKSEMDKRLEKVKEIEALMKSGDLSGAAAGKALAKIKGETQPEKTRFAGALDMGSAEARTAILEAITGRGNRDEAVAKNTADMAGTLKRIEALQRRAKDVEFGDQVELAMM